jgi:hypothetical protein
VTGVAAARTGILTNLFAGPVGARTTRLGVRLAVLAVVVGTVVSLLRTTGTGPLQSIWEEDARDILEDALTTSGSRTLVWPVAGYYVVVPRLLGQLAAFFPIGWAAAVLSISAAIITALLALQVYVASGAHLHNRLARVLVSAPLLFAPVAENFVSEIYNRPVCLHFFAMYALFWLLLWTPDSRWGKGGLLATVGLTGLSTVLIVGYVPLAALRAFVRRDRLSYALLGLTLAGTALQLGSLQLGLTNRGNVGGAAANPLRALLDYVLWAVPNSVLGFDATSDLGAFAFDFSGTLRRNVFVIVASWLLLVAVVVAAVIGSRRGLLKPRWSLAALAAAHSVALLVMMVVANGEIAQRYLLPVELLLFTAVVAVLLPAGGVDRRKAGAMLAVFAVFVGVIGAFNYRWDNTNRAHAPVWTDQVRQATAICQADQQLSHVVVRSGPKPYASTVGIPCHELRRLFVCHPPACKYLGQPQSLGPRR